MLAGLKQPLVDETKENEEPDTKKDPIKMSKSDPMSAIFMEDSAADVTKKIKLAFCEIGNIKLNPVLEYCKYIIFPRNGVFTITRSEKHGGDLHYKNYEQLEKDFVSQIAHPDDLKKSVSAVINDMLEPVRQHFNNDPYAKKILELVRSFTVTR